MVGGDLKERGSRRVMVLTVNLKVLQKKLVRGVKDKFTSVRVRTVHRVTQWSVSCGNTHSCLQLTLTAEKNQNLE